MSRRAFASLSLMGVSLGLVFAQGCGGAPLPAEALKIRSASMPIVSCPPSQGLAACTGRRFVGIFDPKALPDCPVDSKGIWTQSRLFPKAAADKNLVLSKYCVYEWTGLHIQPFPLKSDLCPVYGSSGPAKPDLDVLNTLPGLLEVGEDCIDTGPLQTQNSQASYEETFSLWARETFFNAANGVHPLPTSPRSPTPVRLIAIDTSPDAQLPSGGILLGQNRHGDSLAHIARSLACPDGENNPCSAKVSTSLGLPRYDLANPLAVNTINGGLFGTESDLAVSIERAVRQWRIQALAGQDSPRLILNLSIGWENDAIRKSCMSLDPNNPLSGAQPPSKSVADALRFASCHGALVFAAAGNDSGGSNPASGLVCPAQWESLAAPNASACKALLGDFAAQWAERYPTLPLRPAGGFSAYDRLLYAVSGVDQGDEALVPARANASPRLSALGLLGTGWDASANFSVTPNANGVAPSIPPAMTGSSVATAVASATAAAVWAYAPQLTAPEVLNIIHSSGLQRQVAGALLSDNTGVCALSSPPGICEVRRVSLCAALENVLQNPGVYCKSSNPHAANLQNAPLGADLDSLLGSNFTLDPGQFTLSPTPIAVPHYQYPSLSVVPWSFPQPNWPTCPACTVKILDPSAVILYAKPGQASGYTQNSQIDSLTLTLIDQNGTARSALLAQSINASARIGFRVLAPTGVDLSKTRTAWLSGKATSSTGSTISVHQQIAITH